ncbi:MAG: NUDIX hydrolase [Caldilineaceae bacterium]|nr:NUDIX hydrolase [Caldilineaceae bacterium]
MQRITAVEPAELAELERQWGPVAMERHQLAVDHPFLTGENQMLVGNGRRAEVCYVMHQGNPKAGVLLHIKTFYPHGAYRLPTGGIHQGEGVVDTLAREVEEETGLTVGNGGAQVRVERLLGVVACDFVHGALARTLPFATYAFLVQMPLGAALTPRDASEQIGGWQWRPPAALPQVADYLEQVRTFSPQWGDWGRYRALIHRFVARRV